MDGQRASNGNHNPEVSHRLTKKAAAWQGVRPKNGDIEVLTDSITITAAPANSLLLAAAVSLGKADDESSVALAIELLRTRQLARADVRQKLAVIEERRRFRKSRGLR